MKEKIYQGWFKKATAVFLAMAICFLLASCSGNEDTKASQSIEASLKNSIVFFETDNDADCALISAEGVNIMIDTGEKEDAKSMIKELEARGITRLDYLILSHFDTDHIGGARKILDKISVGAILHPSYIKNSKEAEKLFEAIREKGIKEKAIALKDNLDVKGIKLSFVPAEKERYIEKESNNSSLVVKAEIDGVKALFTGDCQEERIEELLASDNDYSADILKLMYHGREIQNERALIEKINPKYTVVTGEDDKKTRKNLEGFELGDVFFNQNGKIVFGIGGSNITVYEY